MEPQVIACILDDVCKGNEQVSTQRVTVGARFQSSSIPKVSIADYVRRLSDFSRCSPECFVIALVYLDRIVATNPTFVLTYYNIHRLLLTSVMVAAKYQDDLFFTSSHYAAVGGVEAAELNLLELEFLLLTQFNLRVSGRQFRLYHNEVAGHIQRAATKSHALLTTLQVDMSSAGPSVETSTCRCGQYAQTVKTMCGCEEYCSTCEKAYLSNARQTHPTRSTEESHAHTQSQPHLLRSKRHDHQRLDGSVKESSESASRTHHHHLEGARRSSPCHSRSETHLKCFSEEDDELSPCHPCGLTSPVKPTGEESPPILRIIDPCRERESTGTRRTRCYVTKQASPSLRVSAALDENDELLVRTQATGEAPSQISAPVPDVSQAMVKTHQSERPEGQKQSIATMLSSSFSSLSSSFSHLTGAFRRVSAQSNLSAAVPTSHPSNRSACIVSSQLTKGTDSSVSTSAPTSGAAAKRGEDLGHGAHAPSHHRQPVWSSEHTNGVLHKLRRQAPGAKSWGRAAADSVMEFDSDESMSDCDVEQPTFADFGCEMDDSESQPGLPAAAQISVSEFYTYRFSKASSVLSTESARSVHM